MRTLALTLLTVTLLSYPLYAQKPFVSNLPPPAPAPDPIFISALTTAQNIRLIQRTLKPEQKFAKLTDDPRLAPSLEFNVALLKVVTSPLANDAQKREALKTWDDFYRESGGWKPYYFLGTSVPNETMAKMRDFALAELLIDKSEAAIQLTRYLSTFAIFASDRKWDQTKAQELLAAQAKWPLREWALQIRMGDSKVPLAERQNLYRELIALPKTILETRDSYFTSFNTDLHYSNTEEKRLSAQLEQEVFNSSAFSASTRFGAALNISVRTDKPSEKISIYDKALQLSGLELKDKVSLWHWKGLSYEDLKDYPNALKAWDEAATQAGDKLPTSRAEAQFAAAKLQINTLNKLADARPLLDALADDENLNSDDMLQVVLWRTNLELSSDNDANARQVLEKSLLLKKLRVEQKDFLRFQLAQVLVAQKDHVAAIALIEKIPVQNLAAQVQQSGFESMFGLALGAKNFDGARAIIDVWSKRGGIGLLDYTILSGLIFEQSGNLPAALAVYKALLPNLTVQADKDDLSAAIKKLEAQIATPKAPTP